MELIIGIVVGIIIGLVVGTLIFRRRYIPVGDLRIDRSDPTSEPFLFLELGTDVRTISGMKTVTLNVRNENFLPHEYPCIARTGADRRGFVTGRA